MNKLGVQKKIKIDVISLDVVSDDLKFFNAPNCDIQHLNIKEKISFSADTEIVILITESVEKLNIEFIETLKSMLCVDGQVIVPVFAFFKNLPPETCLSFLQYVFSDIRTIPRSRDEFKKAVKFWHKYIVKNRLNKLRKKRMKYFTELLNNNKNTLSRDLFTIQSQLFRVEHILESMELWQNGSRLEKELKIAHSIQNMLLPKELPEFPGFDLDAVCYPAKEVGGDFYDLIRIDKNRMGFIIGDVATRGIPAGLLMAEIRGMWKALIKYNTTTQEVVERINKLICDDLQKMWGMYITFFCGIINNNTNKLFYTNAGHCYPVLYRSAKKEIIELKNGGTVLGISPDTIYEQGEIDIALDDLIVCYTDGITESHIDPNALFGKEKLYEIIKRNAVSSVKYIRDKIFQSLNDFLGVINDNDDKALLIIKNKPS